MVYDSKIRLHRCDSCNRPQNDASVLIDMRKPGTSKPMQICGAGGCYRDANEQGHFGPSQSATST